MSAASPTVAAADCAHLLTKYFLINANPIVNFNLACLRELPLDKKLLDM